MKVRWRYYIKLTEFSARCIVWLGAWTFVYFNVYGIIRITNSPIYVAGLWIFVIATFMTGLLDLIPRLLYLSRLPASE